MNRFKAITAASVMLLATAGTGSALTRADLGLSEETGAFGDYLYTIEAFSAFTTTLQSFLTGSAAFQEVADLIGSGSLLMGGSYAAGTYWSSAISFDVSTLTVSMVGYNFTATPTPIDTSITVPGPVVAAGLPAVIGLIGFAAWRRRHSGAVAA